MLAITQDCKISSAITPTAGAAGQTAINGTTLDMAGFNKLAVIVRMGAITAGGVQSIKLQQGAASNLSDAADLAGTSVTVADDDDGEIFVLEHHNITERYVRVVVSRATQDSVVASAEYIQFGSGNRPVTQPSGTTIEFSAWPIEGTA